MPLQKTAKELFGELPTTKTAGELFGEDTVDDDKIKEGEIPNGDLAVTKPRTYRGFYEDILNGDADWESIVPEGKKPALRQMPDYEGNAKKTINSAYLADLLGTDIDTTNLTHDQLAKELFKADTSGTAFDRIKDRWKNGRIQVQIMDLGYAILKGDGDYEANLEAIQKLQSQLSPDALEDLRWFGEQMVAETTEQIPIMWEAIKASPKGAIPGGLIGALISLGAGAIEPTPVIEAATLVPFTFKGAKIGGGLAAANRIRQLEAGGMYLELLDMEDEFGNKIDPLYAKVAAHSVGLINGGIELAEWAVILGTFGIGTKVFENAARKATTKIFAAGTIKEIVARKLLHFSGAYVTEIGQELLQETNNAVFGKLVVEINNELKGTDIPPITLEEFKARMLEVTKKTAKGMPLMLLPGITTTGAFEIAGRKPVEKVAPAPAEAVEKPVTEGKVKIRAAAYYNEKTGEIAEGPHHGIAYGEAIKKGFFPAVPEAELSKLPKISEGFVTEEGKFVPNPEAEALAKETGQLPKDYKLTQKERILGHPAAETILAETSTPEAPIDLRGEGEKTVAEPVTFDEKQALLEAEAEMKVEDAKVVSPQLYIGNVTARMKKKFAEIFNRLKEGGLFAGEAVAGKPAKPVTIAQLKRNTEVEVKADPVYEAFQERVDIAEKQVPKGIYFVGKNFAGEVKAAIETYPQLKFHISTDETKGHTSWDVAIQESLGVEQADGSYDTSADMDINEFLDRLGQTVQGRAKIGNISAAVLEEMAMSGQPRAEIAALKYTMLQEGFSIEEINENILEIAVEYDIPAEGLLLQEQADVKESKRISEEVAAKERAPQKAPEVSTGEIAPEDVKGFTEEGFPTKRTTIEMTKREAREYLEFLEIDLIERLENKEIITEKDLARANSDWGNMKELRNALGMKVGVRPFKVIRAKKHKMVVIKDTKARMWQAIKPTEASNMTVGQVLSATLAKAAKAASKAFRAGAKEAKALMREKIRVQKQLKKRIDKALRVITSPPGRTIDIFYRKAIELIQNSIDPKKRTKKTLHQRQAAREFLERATPEEKRDFPKKLAELIEKTPLNDLTIAELEEIAETINKLKETGKTKQKAKNALEQAKHDNTKGNLVKTGSKAPVAPDQPRGVDYSQAGFTEGLKNLYLWTLRIPRILDWLDGRKGTFSGVWHRTFYDSVNEQTDKELVVAEGRHKTGTDKMAELGITANELTEVDDFTSLQTNLTLTKEQQMGIYTALKNKFSLDAIVHGNNISIKTAQAIVSNLDKKYIELADFIIEEYQANYERLRAAFIETTDMDLGVEEFYTAMVRLELNEAVTDEEIVQQLTQRLGLKRGYVEKGMTIERKEIAPEHQKPIDLRLVSVWENQVARQEHFIHFAKLLKEMRKLLADKDVKETIVSKLGNQGRIILNSYVDRVANPNIYRAYSGAGRVSRTLRRNVAMSYLAYNLATIAKQVPSMVLLMKDAGPAAMLSSISEFSKNPRKMWDEVRIKAPQLKNAFIERELAEMQEALRQSKDKKLIDKMDLLVSRVGNNGMKGIRFIDGVVRTIGYDAVFNKGKQMGLSDAEAARMAMNAILRTQPAAAAKDIAQMYATDEFFNWFTMFTNQLNQIWNITTYDTFAYWGNQKYQDAAMTLMGVAVNALLIWMVVNKRLPEDDDDLVDAASDQVLNMVPIINSALMAGKEGWGATAPPPIEAAKAAGRVLSQKDKEKAAKRALELSAVLTGIPITGTKRVINVLETGNLLELLGKPKTKGKKLRL